jgi:hypothetical protein
VFPPSPEFIENSTVIALPVNAETVLSGALSPGRIVTILAQPKSFNNGQEAFQIVPKALVLKVRKEEAKRETIDDKTYIAMLVIPNNYIQEMVYSALLERIILSPVDHR